MRAIEQSLANDAISVIMGAYRNDPRCIRQGPLQPDPVNLNRRVPTHSCARSMTRSATVRSRALARAQPRSIWFRRLGCLSSWSICGASPRALIAGRSLAVAPSPPPKIVNGQGRVETHLKCFRQRSSSVFGPPLCSPAAFEETGRPFYFRAPTPDNHQPSPITSRDFPMTDTTESRTNRIRELNDSFRRTFIGGAFMITQGIEAMPLD